MVVATKQGVVDVEITKGVFLNRVSGIERAQGLRLELPLKGALYLPAGTTGRLTDEVRYPTQVLLTSTTGWPVSAQVLLSLGQLPVHISRELKETFSLLRKYVVIQVPSSALRANEFVAGNHLTPP